ncbi:hypothetical protein NQZ68_009020 [Dissostichus eleginoides]|nr:hypothetical protein NQZ68_009020 [Dissostichus eleginoides]
MADRKYTAVIELRREETLSPFPAAALGGECTPSSRSLFTSTHRFAQPPGFCTSAPATTHTR